MPVIFMLSLPPGCAAASGRGDLISEEARAFDCRPLDAYAQPIALRRMDIAFTIGADDVERSRFESGVGHGLLEITAVAAREHEVKVRRLSQGVAPALQLAGH